MQVQIWVDTQSLRLLCVSEAEVHSWNFLSWWGVHLFCIFLGRRGEAEAVETHITGFEFRFNSLHLSQLVIKEISYKMWIKMPPSLRGGRQG